MSNYTLCIAYSWSGCMNRDKLGAVHYSGRWMEPPICQPIKLIIRTQRIDRERYQTRVQILVSYSRTIKSSRTVLQYNSGHVKIETREFIGGKMSAAKENMLRE